MKTKYLFLTTAIVIANCNVANASEQSQNLQASGRHSALASIHGSLATVKIGSAVTAVPLIVGGGLGELSKHAGEKLLEQALQPEPLEITEKTITAAPSPKEAMKINNKDVL